MSDDDVIKKLEDTFKDAARHQRETLSAILERNAGVSYLHPYLRGSDSPVEVAVFRRAVPLSCYADYEELIGNLTGGVLVDNRGRHLLSVDPLLCFFYSSGTNSLKPKLIPCFDSKPGRAASSLAHQASAAILRRSFPARPSASKVLGFLYAGNVSQTRGGFMAMAATAFPFYSNSLNASRFLSIFVSPKEVILGADLNQQMYSHLLCGLRHLDVIDGIIAPYAAGLIRALALLESHWKKLSEDLETGIPSAEISDASMRASLVDIIGGPQPDLSRRVQQICQETSWEGIVSRLWPNARYIKCVSTGSMAQYYPKLQFYAGEIPILGADYFASECCVAINLDLLQPPELTHYVMLPTAAYFEFLPYDLEKSCVTDEETLDLSAVEVGQMYELVVTTFRGLYRQRMGDIVKVVGFHHTSPKIEFVMRAPSSSGQIVTEKDLLSAMATFHLMIREEFGAEILEFSSFLDMESEKKQFNIFIEVKDTSQLLHRDRFTESVSVRRKFCSAVEDGLGGLYQVMRGRGDISPLSLSIVQRGSFDLLLEEAMRNGAPASQYKPPKIIKNHRSFDFLKTSVVMTL